MLETLDGRQVTAVPHRAEFEAIIRRLGTATANAIRKYLDGVINNLSPDSKTGLRTFGSSQLGRELTPWPEPLAQLYWEAWKRMGEPSRDEDVQDRAALSFGLFVWERIVEQEKKWVFWDPNLSATDPNRDPLGKVYFERADGS
jgi:hypothetical protein